MIRNTTASLDVLGALCCELCTPACSTLVVGPVRVQTVCWQDTCVLVELASYLHTPRPSVLSAAGNAAVCTPSRRPYPASGSCSIWVGYHSRPLRPHRTIAHTSPSPTPHTQHHVMFTRCHHQQLTKPPCVPPHPPTHARLLCPHHRVRCGGSPSTAADSHAGRQRHDVWRLLSISQEDPAAAAGRAECSSQPHHTRCGCHCQVRWLLRAPKCKCGCVGCELGIADVCVLAGER